MILSLFPKSCLKHEVLQYQIGYSLFLSGFQERTKEHCTLFLLQCVGSSEDGANTVNRDSRTLVGVGSGSGSRVARGFLLCYNL